MRTLTPAEAKAFYDRFGKKQDKQTFYEALALNALVANADLQAAQDVFEFGCGTGRFALDLLQDHLSPTARYLGIDISTTMVDLATQRLAPFSPRASIVLAQSEPMLPLQDSSIDRFVSTYVLDLLPESALRHVLDEAKRTIRPSGLLCLAGVTHGITPLSRIVMGGWHWLFARRPALVGGCRPTELTKYLSSSAWKIRFHTVVVAWGVASEVLVASPLTPTSAAA